MWVKTRQEVKLGIELSTLTHRLIVMNPKVSKAVLSVDEDGSIDGFAVDGVDAELPLSVIPQLPVLREALVAAGTQLPAHLVFSKVQGEISAAIESTSLAVSV